MHRIIFEGSNYFTQELRPQACVLQGGLVYYNRHFQYCAKVFGILFFSPHFARDIYLIIYLFALLNQNKKILAVLKSCCMSLQEATYYIRQHFRKEKNIMEAPRFCRQNEIEQVRLSKSELNALYLRLLFKENILKGQIFTFSRRIQFNFILSHLSTAFLCLKLLHNTVHLQSVKNCLGIFQIYGTVQKF